jgi:hypothetical protein
VAVVQGAALESQVALLVVLAVAPDWQAATAQELEVV